MSQGRPKAPKVSQAVQRVVDDLRYAKRLRAQRLEEARWPDRAKQASAVARVQRTGWGGQ